MRKADKNTVKPTVISFRITAAQTKTLDAIRTRQQVIGIKSSNQYARKILSDFLAGRVVYKNPKDQYGDLEALAS